MIRLLLAAALVLAFGTERATACSCMDLRAGRRLLIPDGEVPRDVTLRVFTTGFPEEVRRRLGAEYRLRASGRNVPLRARWVQTRMDLEPRRPLRPGTDHVLEQLVAYGADGVRMSDDQRLARARNGRGARVAWFPVARFRTGSGGAPDRSVEVSFRSAEIDFLSGGGDCGPATTLFAERTVSGAVPGDVVELEHRGQGVVATVPATEAEIWVGDAGCSPDPVHLRYRPGSAIRIAVRDARGELLGVSPWKVLDDAPPRGGAPHARVEGGAAPVAAHWSDFTLEAPAVRDPSGPPGCAHGFEEAFRRRVETRAPSAYGERSTLDTHGSEHWLTFADGDHLALLRGNAERSRQWVPRVVGRPSVLHATERGPLLVTERESGGATLHALSERGRVRWERPLPHPGATHRLVRGEGRVLVAWGARRIPSYDRELAWAVLDEATGSVVRSVHRTQMTIGTDTTEGPAVASLSDHFLIAWTPRTSGQGALYTMVVGRDGEARDRRRLDLYGEGVPDMAGAGSRAGLVNGRDGSIQFAMVDARGGLVGFPRRIGEGAGDGDPRLPRIAWDSERFAVAWESSTGGAYVAAVGTDGRDSPALRLDALEPDAGTVGIAPVPGGFVASYSAGENAVALVGLRCRQGAPPGPPQRIAPVATDP